MDLRNDQQTIQKLQKNKQKPKSTEDGDRLAKELKSVKYVECSALTQVSNYYLWAIFWFKIMIDYKYSKTNVTIDLKLQEGLKNVFDEAIIAAMEPPAPPKKNFGCQLI